MKKMCNQNIMQLFFIKTQYKALRFLGFIFLNLAICPLNGMELSYGIRSQEEASYIDIVSSLPSRFEVKGEIVESHPQELHDKFYLINELVSIGSVYASFPKKEDKTHTRQLEDLIVKRPNSLVVHLNLLYSKNGNTKYIEGGYLRYSDGKLSIQRNKATIFISGCHNGEGSKETDALTNFLNSAPLGLKEKLPKMNTYSSAVKEDDNLTKGHTEEFFTDLFFAPYQLENIAEELKNLLEKEVNENVSNSEESLERTQKRRKSPPSLVLLFDLGSYNFICKEDRDVERESCRSLLFAITNGPDQVRSEKLKGKVNKYYESIGVWLNKLKAHNHPIETLKCYFRFSSINPSLYYYRNLSYVSQCTEISNDPICFEGKDKVKIPCFFWRERPPTKLENLAYFIEFFRSKTREEGLYEKQLSKTNKAIVRWLKAVNELPPKCAHEGDLPFHTHRQQEVKKILEEIMETDRIKTENRARSLSQLYEFLKKTQYPCQCGNYYQCGKPSPKIKNTKRKTKKEKAAQKGWEQAQQKGPCIFDIFKGEHEGHQITITFTHNNKFELQLIPDIADIRDTSSYRDTLRPEKVGKYSPHVHDDQQTQVMNMLEKYFFRGTKGYVL